ncbi:hypothetical protein DMN91_010526, partial [Ooceraea biroi]
QHYHSLCHPVAMHIGVPTGVIKGKQKWIAVVGRGKNWTPSSSQKVCEVHFTPSEIEFVAERKQVNLVRCLLVFYIL